MGVSSWRPLQAVDPERLEAKENAARRNAGLERLEKNPDFSPYISFDSSVRFPCLRTL
jgi:hypothetical protein